MTPIIRSNAGKGVADAFRRSVRRRPGLRKLLAAISKAVTDAGGTVYLAGGYPRDLLERKATGDVDLMVTEIGHRRLGALLRSLPAGDSGIRGIVSAGRLFPVYRIATAGEKGYVDASAGRSGPTSTRRGASAPAGAADPGAFEDASRRDFTINSLLLPFPPGRAARDGELLDFFGGVDDLRRKRIRCVGDPEDRFREDPVRMLRAVRFRNERKGFTLDPGTERASRRLAAALLPGVPMERVSAELVRSLSANPAGTVEDLRRFRLLPILLPELGRGRGDAARIVRRYRFLVRSIGRPLPLPILLANLFADLSHPRAKEALRRLRLPSIGKVAAVLSALETLLHPERSRFPLAETEAVLLRAGDPRGLGALYRAVAKESGRRAMNIKSFFNNCRSTPVWVNGSYLVKYGFPEGPGRAEALLRIREASLAGEVRGKRDAEAFARSLKGL
jgi:tRNA nucleotidyltransferase/poly(A) polymerase